MESPSGRLASSRQEYKNLGELLARQREALRGRELSRALGLLEEFSRRLHRHLRWEEEMLLPAFALRAAKGQLGDLLAEHRTLREEVSGLLAALRGLGSSPDDRGPLAGLLEREERFLDLISRHAEHEQRVLSQASGGEGLSSWEPRTFRVEPG